MQIIFEHSIIFFQIFVISIFLSLCGFLLKKIILNEHDVKNFEENGLFGFLLVGFIALSINFFTSLNPLINSFFFIILTFTAYKFGFFNQNSKKLFKCGLYASALCYILFIYSNVNTPDALLYHLPYSKILNEHKVIIGLSNLHSRFGHISIFQYISSFFNNYGLNTNGLLIPIGILVSFFFIYSFKIFKENFIKENLRLHSYFIFLTLIFSFYSFNRYSGFGNDAQVHIYYFLIIFYLLDFLKKQDSFLIFKKLSLVCLFTFLIKPFYLISLLFPFLIYLKIRDKFIILRSKFFIFSSLFVVLWLFKNILISGCLIYPIKTTCSSNFFWYSASTELESLNGEAWAKDWINREDTQLSQNKYIEGFDWVSTWLQNHFSVIIEKLTPFIIFILINILIFYLTKSLKINFSKHNQKFYLLIFIINFIGVLIWFLKFPIYRYGMSFIYSAILFLLFFIYIQFIDLKKMYKLKRLFFLFIYLSFFGLVTKNINRIYNDYNQSISPNILDVRNTKSKTIKIFNQDKIFTHYKNTNGAACGFTLSPCSHFEPNVIKKIVFGYTIYYNY